MPEAKKILIVDDDNQTREMYAEIFKNSGFEVIEANDGLEGLDLATQKAPDIIFTGIIMPRMDGFSMIEALKKNVSTANIPVVVSSHMGREEDKQKAEKLGVKDFIVRDTTPPNKVIDRINALSLKGMEYKLDFDVNSPGAQGLAKDFNLKSGFHCSKCDEKMALSLKIEDAHDFTFRAHFACPKCGWKKE